jgi:hypothetical protein
LKEYQDIVSVTLNYRYGSTLNLFIDWHPASNESFENISQHFAMVDSTGVVYSVIPKRIPLKTIIYGALRYIQHREQIASYFEWAAPDWIPKEDGAAVSSMKRSFRYQEIVKGMLNDIQSYGGPVTSHSSWTIMVKAIPEVEDFSRWDVYVYDSEDSSDFSIKHLQYEDILGLDVEVIGAESDYWQAMGALFWQISWHESEPDKRQQNIEQFLRELREPDESDGDDEGEYKWAEQFFTWFQEEHPEILVQSDVRERYKQLIESQTDSVDNQKLLQEFVDEHLMDYLEFLFEFEDGTEQDGTITD